MNNQEPSGYENEPEEQFVPLPPELYCSFFDLEMSKKLDDCRYYAALLKNQQCRRVLELGCGTGRIVEYLSAEGYRTVGIDNSPDMLLYQRRRRQSPVAEMDMGALGFSRQCFDAALIPHNTLNLLGEKRVITRCLREIRNVLAGDGLLVAQLFAVTDQLREQAGKRLFQFALFDTPDNGKLVKETIRTYLPESGLLLLEERYKRRSFANPALNKNYRQLFSLAAFSPATWLQMIRSAGFAVVSQHSGYRDEPFLPGTDSSLLISARPL